MTDLAGSIVVGIDAGGTFTDGLVVRRDTGETHLLKVPSTPDDPSQAFITALNGLLERIGGTPDDVSHVFHGTTVATNAILEGKGGPAAFLVNRGFRHLIEIGRHDIPRDANMYWWQKPPRPVSADEVFEIGGRLDAEGQELEQLDEQSVRDAARKISESGARSVAVCFLHSFANPEHETRTGKLLASLCPDLLISLSSEVRPVFREYERSMTTLLNAYVMPRVSSYIERIGRRMTDAGYSARLLIMKSDGGTAGTRSTARTPVHTALSGPAAGVVGAAKTSAKADFRDLITIDIGGTSADIALVKGGQPRLSSQVAVGNWPLLVTAFDIRTIGAGGGSVARVSKEGALLVGPESAGAVPGPVAYGRGGEQPTVTDAHAALGHFPTQGLAGQLIKNRDGAVTAIKTAVANPLGLSVEAAAEGILQVADNNMVGAIRVVSVEQGHDPADFALVPFGGAGPMHGAAIAALLGMPRVLIPRMAGVLSSAGLVTSDVRTEFSHAFLGRVDAVSASEIEALLGELKRKADVWLDEEQVPRASRSIDVAVEMRYVNQGGELRVPWQGNKPVVDALAAATSAFHLEHERVFSFSQTDTPVETVAFTVQAVGKLPALKEAKQETADQRDFVVGEQPAYFAGQWHSTAVIDRSHLGPGTTFMGPALVVQDDSTTVVPPLAEGRVDQLGNLILHLG